MAQKKTVAAWLVSFGAWIAPFLPVVIGSGAKIRELCNDRLDIDTAFDELADENEWTESEIETALESLVPDFNQSVPITPSE